MTDQEKLLIQQFSMGLIGLLAPAITPLANTFLGAVFDRLPDLINAGADAASWGNAQINRIAAMVKEGRDPTPAEWDTLDSEMNAEMARMRANVNTPMPTMPPTEPEPTAAVLPMTHQSAAPQPTAPQPMQTLAQGATPVPQAQQVNPIQPIQPAKPA